MKKSLCFLVLGMICMGVSGAATAAESNSSKTSFQSDANGAVSSKKFNEGLKMTEKDAQKISDMLEMK